MGSRKYILLSICIIIVEVNLHQELYEPLWEDIYARSKSNGFRIRGIWIADTAMQGASGILNEQLLGNDRKSPTEFHLLKN